MSKKHVSFPLLVFAFSLILQIVNNSAAQGVSVQLTLLENAWAVEVSGSFDLSTPRVNPRNLSFVNEYAGTSGSAIEYPNSSCLILKAGPSL
jgi:hypothetical protein